MDMGKDVQKRWKGEGSGGMKMSSEELFFILFILGRRTTDADAVQSCPDVPLDK